MRGNRKRFALLLLVGTVLVGGGIGSALAVRALIADRIVVREAVEEAARRAGVAAPEGVSAELLRKEERVIPYLLHIFTFGGVVLLIMALGEARGWRAVTPVWEPPADRGASPADPAG